MKSNDELQEETFEYQDDTEINNQVIDDLKYTKIDCLDEDEHIDNQSFVLLSFVSPEGIMNCKVRGIKIRGIYASESEAHAACEKLKKKDKYFDIFVGEVGKWLPWDPSTKQVKEVKFRNKKLDKIMNKVHQSELNTLNEVVGRRKEMIDKESKSHKNRIKESIKESVENYNDSTQEQESKPIKQQKNKDKYKDKDVVRQRLKKMMEDREKSKITNTLQQIDLKSENTDNIEDKLKKMKTYFEQKKASQTNISNST